jgi:hypothetical protein
MMLLYILSTDDLPVVIPADGLHGMIDLTVLLMGAVIDTLVQVTHGVLRET